MNRMQLFLYAKKRAESDHAHAQNCRQIPYKVARRVLTSERIKKDYFPPLQHI